MPQHPNDQSIEHVMVLASATGTKAGITILSRLTGSLEMRMTYLTRLSDMACLTKPHKPRRAAWGPRLIVTTYLSRYRSVYVPLQIFEITLILPQQRRPRCQFEQRHLGGRFSSRMAATMSPGQRGDIAKTFVSAYSWDNVETHVHTTAHYVRGVCAKARIKCGDCPTRHFCR
jgi:hypothetical protein